MTHLSQRCPLGVVENEGNSTNICVGDTDRRNINFVCWSQCFHILLSRKPPWESQARRKQLTCCEWIIAQLLPISSATQPASSPWGQALSPEAFTFCVPRTWLAPFHRGRGCSLLRPPPPSHSQQLPHLILLSTIIPVGPLTAVPCRKHCWLPPSCSAWGFVFSVPLRNSVKPRAPY